MDLVIKRSEWYRGQSGTDSRLLRKDGMKCCLGFLALACGLTEDQIRDVPSPYSLAKGHGVNLPPSMQFLLLTNPTDNSNDGGELMEYNDSPRFSSESAREEKLSAIFSRNGINVTFVD